MLSPHLNVGVYRGPSNPATEIAAFEAWLGRPVQHALAFLASDSWTNQEWPNWQITAWNGVTTPISLGAVAYPTSGSVIGNWTEAAAGSYDVHWTNLAQRLIDSGHSNAHFRFAHEFNGSWYGWRVPDSDRDVFLSATKRFIDVVRSVSGDNFKFIWNVANGQQNYPKFAERVYPGPGWIDFIGVDLYDSGYTSWTPGTNPQPSVSTQQARWDSLLNGDHGVMFWLDFARSEGLQLALPEVGLRLDVGSDGKTTGGGDNPYFIEQVYRFCQKYVRGPIGLWEKPGMGVYDPDNHPNRVIAVPNSRAKFLEMWKL